jgi:hypothetical protein
LEKKKEVVLKAQEVLIMDLKKQLDTQLRQQQANARREEREQRSRRTGTRKTKSSVARSGGARFAIMRTAKLKSFVQITGAQKHNNRAQDTPNADPSRLDLNQQLIGTPDLNADVRARIGDATIRKNAVICVEQLLTASPDFFEKDPSTSHGYNQQQLDAWVKANLDYISHKWGDNCVNAVLHLDETTPHIHLFIVPMDYSKKATGSLNAAGLIGGHKYKMKKMQDEYAEAMKPFGLERGIQKTKANHEDIKRLYADIEQAPELASDYQVEKPGIGDKWKADQYAQKQVDQATKELNEKNQRLRNQNKKLRKDLERAQKQVKAASSIRDRADLVRDMDLHEVMVLLGGERDKYDKAKYDLNGLKISINGEKFYDHTADHGGGGAIDLVMHAHDCNFKTAVRWLSGNAGAEIAASAATARQHREMRKIAAEPIEFIEPERSDDPAHVNEVRKYLIDQRRIPARIVDDLIDRGDVYPEAKQGKNGRTFVNAVMLMRSANGRIVGAEINGTGRVRFKGTATGSNKEKGAFTCGPDKPERVVFVESAIDAMSYHALYPTHKAVSCVGVAAPERIDAMKERYMYELDDLSAYSCGFDNDDEGNRAADKLGLDRVKPGVDQSKGVDQHGKRPEFKDWNERLQREREVADEQRGGDLNKAFDREYARGSGLER